MRDTLTHRGPDDRGVFIGEGVGLGSRRLAILDLSPLGHMPMSVGSGRYIGVYNGEVYNFRELREELRQQGYRFRSETDTEVILTLFDAHGPDMLEKLNGMFAIAIWDTEQRRLFIARDRLGVKPLYYAFADGALWFASEEKALFAAGVSRDFDPSTWSELLCFRYVAGTRTPFAAVQRLLPGHWMLWSEGRVEIRRWWSLSEKARAAREDGPRDPVSWFAETFDSSVAYRAISDVPVGVLLSGGLDSSSVALSLARLPGPPVASFTVRFSDQTYDESPLARQVAARGGLEYHDLVVKDEELLSELTRASYLNDEPLVHGNDLHLLAISRYARPRVTVLLSGEGADETLGGYVRYRPLLHPHLLASGRAAIGAAARWSPWASKRLAKLQRFLDLRDTSQFVLFNACDVLPSDLARIGMDAAAGLDYRRRVLDEAVRLYPREPVRQAMYSDQHTFLCSILDRNDRMTMGSSIECRVPFLDYRLVEGLAGLPTRLLVSMRRGKLLLRRALGDRLPASVQRAPKWGFAVPWHTYFRRVPALREVVMGLPDHDLFATGPFDRARLRATLTRFFAGDDTDAMLIRQMLMVAVWHSAIRDADYRTPQDERPSGRAVPLVCS